MGKFNAVTSKGFDLVLVDLVYYLLTERFEDY